MEISSNDLNELEALAANDGIEFDKVTGVPEENVSEFGASVSSQNTA